MQPHFDRRPNQNNYEEFVNASAQFPAHRSQERFSRSRQHYYQSATKYPLKDSEVS